METMRMYVTAYIGYVYHVIMIEYIIVIVVVLINMGLLNVDARNA